MSVPVKLFYSNLNRNGVTKLYLTLVCSRPVITRTLAAEKAKHVAFVFAELLA